MDYQKALDIAVQAALDAATILRRHFHQPGGPGGPRGKAPADLEAEHGIRARLLEAFPGWGYRGEETGNAGLDAAPSHVWLVDPNDGTEAYQRGRRGPSVAIGLVCEGRPVLGVVYSHGFPDDRGDLLCWAEGCGPLRRNGRELTSPRWPERRDPEAILLLSPGNANHKTARVTAVTGPARLRGLSSIAYRLALAAAGEAAAAVSLHSPCGWDYAAAHALLLGAGGVLLDGDGRPVTYTATGESLARFCFGGAPATVAELAARDWRQVIGPPGPTRDVYDLLEPKPGMALRDSELLSRAQGCLLGQIATGDYEMALMLARSIIKEGRYSPEAAGRAYDWWMASQPSGSREPAMRIAPLAVWGHALPAEELAVLARADARLTHPDPASGDAAAAHAVALAGAMRGRETIPADQLHKILTCRPAGRPRACWPVDVLDLAERLAVSGGRAPTPR